MAWCKEAWNQWCARTEHNTCAVLGSYHLPTESEQREPSQIERQKWVTFSHHEQQGWSVRNLVCRTVKEAWVCLSFSCMYLKFIVTEGDIKPCLLPRVEINRCQVPEAVLVFFESTRSEKGHLFIQVVKSLATSGNFQSQLYFKSPEGGWKLGTGSGSKRRECSKELLKPVSLIHCSL